MPIMRKDEVGAIIFDLTPEEQAVQDLHNRVSDLEAQLEELKKQVSKQTSSAKAPKEKQA